MVSASKQAVEQTRMAISPASVARPVAHLSARVSAYLVDSVILLAFIMVCFVLAGLQLLVASNRADGDPPGAAIVAFILIFSGGALVSWTIVNVALMRWRGQTAGMYVIGIKAVSENTPALTTARAAVRWFALHPLFFHPFLLPLWVILTLLSVDFALSRLGVVTAVALILLTLVSPVVNLLLMLFDDERRALHDRLAHTLVVHIKQS